MNLQKVLIVLAVFVAMTFSVSAWSGWWPFSSNTESSVPQQEVTEVEWDDLIPDDFVQPENPFITMSQDKIDQLMDGSEESNAELNKLQAEFSYAPVVDDLDGKRVKIPAYITPLEYDNLDALREFLLVPYVGACIHTPPPPANQVVHAQSEDVVKFNDPYQAVWAIGIIRTETINSDLAESGYRLEVEKVLPYE